MFVLASDIKIGQFRIRNVSDIKIESSLKVLEDTAIIKLPTTALLKRTEDTVTEVETAKQFKVGDEVTINFGYDGNLNEEFRGFVRKIKPKTPLEIEFEDATYLLKRKNLKAAFKNTTLKELLNFILEGTGISLYAEVPQIRFSVFYFRDVNAAKALQKLKEEYGLVIYFKEFKKLFVGLSSDSDDVVVKYEIGYNVIDNKLEYQNEEDVKLSIKAVLIKPDNTRIEKEVGDKDGEKRTLFTYDLEDGQSLESWAKEEILKYKFKGYKGSLTTFLLPGAKVGNVARITNEQFDEEPGDYLIEKIETTFGQGGGRRSVHIGLKLK